MFILPTLKGLAGNSLSSNTFKNAALDLNFASDKSLVDSVSGNNLITFQRQATAPNQATYVGADGLVKTAVTNLALRSEDFSDAVWAKPGGTTCNPNAVTAPNGTTTADKLVEFNGTVNQSFEQTITLALGTAYSISIYAKAAERTQFRLAGRTSGNWSIFPSGRFDLSAGTVLTSSGDKTATISPVGNGWYRCTIYGTSAVGTSAGMIVSPLLTGGTTSTYAGDGTSGIYLWGAQLEASSTAGDYLPTTTVSLSAPRFDHNPITGESLGLLIEDTRTNLIYPSQFTSFGTVAANNTWYETFTELDCTPNSATAPDGTNTAALLAINTNATSRPIFYRTANTTAGSYTFSVYCKPASTDTLSRLLIAGEAGLTNFVRADFTLTGSGTAGAASTGGTATVPAASAPLIQQLTNGWYRCIITATLTSPTNITCLVYPGNPAGQTINSQTFVWGAQVEAGVFPTSYIPTTTATVTRAADVASVTGANFSSWYNQTEGTVFLDSVQANITPTTRMVSISDGTGTNRFALSRGSSSSGNIGLVVTNGGTSQVAGFFLAINFPAGSSSKSSYAYKASDFAGIVNNGTVATQASGTIPTVTQLGIGNGEAAGVNVMNGTIKRLTYWKTRLPNVTLQAITTS